MAFSNFIPEIWSARLLEHMDKVHVYANLMNRDYEGDIKAYGDTVHINLLGDITISNYTGGALGTPQELDSTKQTLEIDQAKYFNFIVKDIDNAQSNPKLVDAAMVRASYNMNDVIDKYLANLLVTGTATANVLYGDDSPIVPTSETAYNLLVDMGVALSEANAPMYGRWVVVPPWFHGLLLKDDRMSLLPQVKKTGSLPHHWKNFRAAARKPSACFKVSISSGSILRTRWWSFLWMVGRT